uniref:Uncharacterized protein n=1 Tax=Babesia bovis TaxID=5865 RepID=A7ARU4_BABBO|eukprot:XP_001610831.1 hypothetical protein [Babesia bovis T2Bo]
MILSPSEDEGCVTEKEETQTKESGFTAFRPSGLIYRHIKQLTNAKLIHLAKRMICENTVWAHNEALKIILIQLRSIPPLGHIAEDLMLAFIHLLQRDHKSCLDDKKPYDSAHDDMFHKFLSISGSTSPFLRPLIMTHATRIKASNGNIYEMMHQIKRNCAEWNLEKHYLAQYYKWIVNHAETLTNYDATLSNSYIVELEHILKSYAELKSLPNEALFRLYIEANTTDTLKSKEVLDEFIELYPNVNYLRKYRAMLSDRKPKVS